MLTDQYSAIDSKTANQPKSIIMTYGVSGDNYNEFNPQPVTTAIMASIYKKWEKYIWNSVIVGGVGTGGVGWKAYEYYCLYWIKNRNASSKLKFKKFIYGKVKSKYVKSGKVTQDDRNDVSLLGCISIKGTENDLFEEAVTTENELFFSLEPQNPFIDSLYRIGNKYIGIQKTVGTSHSFSLKSMEEYTDRAKALDGEFQLFYLVLATNLDTFKLDLAGTAGGKKEIRERGEFEKWKIYIVGITGPNDPS